MSETPNAVLQIRRGDDARAGPERVQLLREIRDRGSIAAAGRAVGLTYRAAWNAVRALNVLFDKPLVLSQAGGAQGGGATLTPAGETVVAAYDRLQGVVNTMLDDLSANLSGAKDGPAVNKERSMQAKVSARNVLRGVVERVTDGAVNAEVVLRVGSGTAVVAIVTRESVRDLALAPGREAEALIKASSIILAPGDPPRTSARNQLTGVVTAHEVGAVNDEVVLTLDDGGVIAAVITRGSGEALGLGVGQRATALVKASQVILAVD